MSLVSEQAGFDALNALVVDPLLEQLNDSLSKFNLFEALGAVRQELRHSNFLAWLLNPSENHGLGDYALRKFVMLVAREINDPSANISPSWPLENAEIRREWRNIDILIADPQKKYVVVIENKIYSGEHSGQLERYQDIVETEYPNAVRLFVFLTPYGMLPQNEESDYLPLDYSTIHQLITDVLVAKQNTLSTDVQTFISHYNAMLERHLLEETPIAKLCREIYAKHQHALDLILEHRPDVYAQLNPELTHLVENTLAFDIYWNKKRDIDFVVKEWQPFMTTGDLKWNDLYFNIKSQNEETSIILWLGGVDTFRHQVLQTVLTCGLPFNPDKRVLKKKWNRIYQKQLLSHADYKVSSLGELIETATQGWQEFLEIDFPRINEVILREVVHGYRGVE